MPEPIRSVEPQVPTAPMPSLSVHKLRQLAARGLGEVDVQRLFVTQDEDFERPTPRHVITVGDVTRGLGLDADTETRVQTIVRATRTDFNRRSGNTRLTGARGLLIAFLRGRKDQVSSDLRLEIVRRADAFWRKRGADDMRYVVKSERKPEPVLAVPVRMSERARIHDFYVNRAQQSAQEPKLAVPATLQPTRLEW